MDKYCKNYIIKNETNKSIKIEISVNFLGGFIVRGFYYQQFVDDVLLYEEKFDNIEILLDEEKLYELINKTHEKIMEKRSLLININDIFTKFKTYSIED